MNQTQNSMDATDLDAIANTIHAWGARFQTEEAFRSEAQEEMADWPDVRHALVAGIEFVTMAAREADPTDPATLRVMNANLRVLLEAQIAVETLAVLRNEMAGSMANHPTL